MIKISDYVKLYRKFMEWEWYTDVNTKTLFLHLLLKANWKAGKWQGQIVKRGQLISSQQKLSDQTGLTVNEIRTAIKHLELTNEITSVGTRRNTVFTVVNYDMYQTVNESINEQITDKPQPINDLLTTIEEKKEEKEGKNKRNNTNFSEVVDAYNSICTSLPKVIKLTNSRKRAIKSMMDKHGLKELKRAFSLSQESDFLSGRNGKWNATFDWIMTENNLVKILEDNYRNKESKGKRNKFNNFDGRSYDMDELERQLINA